jgi:HAE1 family hydrophobic/amphiphilic exporter-1
MNLDAVKMQAYGLSIPQVQQNILSSNLDFRKHPNSGTKILIQLENIKNVEG